MTSQTYSIKLFNINSKGRRFFTQFVFLKPLLWMLSCTKMQTYGLISNLWILKFINIQYKNGILNMRKHCVTITTGCLMTFREINSHWCTAYNAHILCGENAVSEYLKRFQNWENSFHSPNTLNSPYLWAGSINQEKGYQRQKKTCCEAPALVYASIPLLRKARTINL